MHPATHLPRALAVDDDPSFLSLLERTLTSDGLEVTSVTSGEAAISAAKVNPPDVILLDICMEGIDGLETCRCLKANALTAGIAIILMTAQERSDENLAEAFAAGACDYITKPISRVDVLSRVHDAVRRRRQRALVQKLDTYDPLTGLPNRSYLRTRVDEELLGVARHGSDLALIMAEIDDLDRIGQDYGQEGQEHLLRRFSLLVQSEATHHDVAGCWGPRQLVLLLPRVGINAAAAAAAGMYNVWQMIKMPLGHQTLCSTASFGVTALSREKTAATGGALVRSAEQALGRAQEAGGNRVMVAEETFDLAHFPQPAFGPAGAAGTFQSSASRPTG